MWTSTNADGFFFLTKREIYEEVKNKNNITVSHLSNFLCLVGGEKPQSII